MLGTRKGKIAIIIMAIALVISCSIAGVAILQKKPSDNAAKKQVIEEPGDMLSMGELIVNLADTSEIHYLKTDIVLEVSGAQANKNVGDDTTQKAPLRDAIIGVLSSKRFAELNCPGGKETLKTELQEVCGQCLKPARVLNVYFSEFAMQ